MASQKREIWLWSLKTGLRKQVFKCGVLAFIGLAGFVLVLTSADKDPWLLALLAGAFVFGAGIIVAAYLPWGRPPTQPGTSTTPDAPSTPQQS